MKKIILTAALVPFAMAQLFAQNPDLNEKIVKEDPKNVEKVLVEDRENQKILKEHLDENPELKKDISEMVEKANKDIDKFPEQIKNHETPEQVRESRKRMNEGDKYDTRQERRVERQQRESFRNK